MALRQGNWMYISGQDGGGFGGTAIGMQDLGEAAATLLTGEKNSDIENGKIKPGAPPAQLYDLEKDPSQTRNLYDKYPAIATGMQAKLEQAINGSTSTRPQW